MPEDHTPPSHQTPSVASSEDSSGRSATLGRIQLKQVRLSRSEARAGIEAPPEETEAWDSEVSSPSPTQAAMERLVHYLDLFERLDDRELARLAEVDPGLVTQLRGQVEHVHHKLGQYADLLPRLSNDELARLADTDVQTIRFWRLSQPWIVHAPEVPPGAPRETQEPSVSKEIPSFADSDRDAEEFAASAPPGPDTEVYDPDPRPRKVASGLRPVAGPPPRGRAYALHQEQLPVIEEDTDLPFVVDE